MAGENDCALIQVRHVVVIERSAIRVGRQIGSVVRVGVHHRQVGVEQTVAADVVVGRPGVPVRIQIEGRVDQRRVNVGGIEVRIHVQHQGHNAAGVGRSRACADRRGGHIVDGHAVQTGSGDSIHGGRTSRAVGGHRGRSVVVGGADGDGTGDRRRTEDRIVGIVGGVAVRRCFTCRGNVTRRKEFQGRMHIVILPPGIEYSDPHSLRIRIGVGVGHLFPGISSTPIAIDNMIPT